MLRPLFSVLLICFGIINFNLNAADLVEVSIESSLDHTQQPSLAYYPQGADAEVPLLVLLHTWSGDYKQKGHIEVALKECQERKWALIHPNFRGPNWTPEACGSDLAVQDIVDAINWMKQHHKIDSKRVYATGVSGGGHMSMLMAGRHPKEFAAVSAWVGISDVGQWYHQTKASGRNYYQHVEKAVGGVPGSSQVIDEQLKHRSPITFLENAKGLPLDLNAGVHDGHTGSVPINQTLQAFNKVAESNGKAAKQLTSEQIEFMTAQQKIPDALTFHGKSEKRQHEILFRRKAGAVRVTIFEGGHEGDLPTAIEWLSTHSR